MSSVTVESDRATPDWLNASWMRGRTKPSKAPGTRAHRKSATSRSPRPSIVVSEMLRVTSGMSDRNMK